MRSAWAKFLLGFVGGSVYVWIIAGRDYGSLFSASLILFLLAIVAGYCDPKGFLRAGALVGLGLPAAYFVRMVYEVSHDPTSNNLWPIAMVMFCVIASPALVGALLGRVIRGQTS